MKKRILSLLIGICAAATVTGCGSGAVSNDKIKIAQYKGVEVEKVEAVKVLDEHVEESIQSTLQAKSTQKEITDRPVKEGDVVTIDYVGKKDGEAFDGGTAEDYQLPIGSGQFIDGFEDGIIGHETGETFDLNLTFPENYQSEDLAGKEVVFTVTLDKIAEVVVPELTDELVAELSEESKTVDEFKKEVKKDLEKSNKQTAESRLKQNVWGEVVKNCTVEKFPEDKKKELMDSLSSQYGSIASMYGVQDVDQFVQQMFGVSIEQMAKETITQEYAVELIAKNEKLTVSDEDYKKNLKVYAERFGYPDTKSLEEAVGKKDLKKAMLQEKVTNLLVDNCKQVEKKAEEPEKKEK